MVMRAVIFSQAVLGGAASRTPRVFLRPATAMAAKSQQVQPSHQPTYGDVFNVQGPNRDKPITPEEAARMRSVESATLGQVVKGGTAAKMQSAVDKATNAGPQTAASTDVGVDVDAAALPTLDEIVASPMENVDIDVAMGSLPATGRVDVVDHPITIGEALEVAGENIGSKPIDEKDARVIQSAESRATGNEVGVKRVVAAEAQVAAGINAAGSTEAIPTVQDVLSNASAKMPIDKVVTHEDAARVQAVEQRSSGGNLEPGGIAATLQSAADKNAASDFEPRTGKEGRIPNNL